MTKTVRAIRLARRIAQTNGPVDLVLRIKPSGKYTWHAMLTAQKFHAVGENPHEAIRNLDQMIWSHQATTRNQTVTNHNNL
jgi:hypothetical protein